MIQLLPNNPCAAARPRAHGPAEAARAMHVDPTLAGSAAPVHAMGVPAARERAMKPPDRAVQRRADARLASIALLGMTLLMHANPAKALLSDLAVFVTSDGTELTLYPAFAPSYTTADATFSFSTIAWPDTAMVTVNATVGEWQPNDINVVFVGLTDADPDTDGFQVSLSQGRNTITVRSVVSRGDQIIAQYDHVLTVWRPYTTTCHRTDVVRRVILDAVSGVDHCAEITATHLSGIAELAFTNPFGTGIRTLKSGDFAGLTGLVKLDFHRSIPIGSGRTLTLPPDIFDGLTSLEVLSLSGNHIPSLPAGVFDDLTALTELDCRECYIGSVPANTFSGPTRLETLELSITADTLPAGIFDGLTALTRLELGSDFTGDTPALSSIRSDIFDDLTALEDLTIHGLDLQTLPAGIFDELTALTELEISVNALTGLPASVFDELSALTSLSLEANELASLPAGIFDALTGLTRLNLGRNRLQTLPDDLFDKLTALTDLLLYGNPGTTTFVPTALAGDDRTVGPGAVVTLDGSASGGAWGTNVTYAWTQISGMTASLTGADTATPSFTAPASTPDMTYELTVTGVSCTSFCIEGQSSVLSSSDTVDIVVPAVMLSLSSVSIRESDDSDTSDVEEHKAAVTATLSHASTAETAVTVSAAAVSPAVAGDFTLSANKVLTIAAGQTTSTGAVTITAVDNSTDAPNKTVTVSATAANTLGVSAPEAVTLTVIDDEGAPTVILSLEPASIRESDDPGTTDAEVHSTAVTATLSHASTAETTVTVSAAAVSPAVAGDFSLSTNKVLTVAAGQKQSTGAVTISAVDNNIDGPDKTVTVSGVAANTQGKVDPADITLSIADDDAAPTPSITVTDASIAEASGSTTVTITTGTGSTYATARTVTLTLGGAATRNDDYTVVATSLTLPAGTGTAASTVTTTVTAVQDRIDEDAETVVLGGSVGAGTAAAALAPVTVTVDDDDDPPVLQFTSSATQIAEDGGIATLTVDTGTGSTFEEDQTVSLSALDGTAVAGSAYELELITLTLPAGSGQNPSSVATTVTGLDDAYYEGQADQTFTVSAARGEAAIGAPIEIAIDDDEAPSKPAIVLSPSSIVEGGRSDIKARVSPPAEVGFWLRVKFEVHGTRYAFITEPGLKGGSFNEYAYIEFPPGGTTSVPREFWISAHTNEEDDGDATIGLSGVPIGFDAGAGQELANPLPGILDPDPVALIILDDDTAPDTVTLSVDVSEVGEGDGAAAITVTGTLSEAGSDGATAVTVSVGSGTGDARAVAATDFAEVGDFQLTIPQGDTSATAAFTLTPIEDIVDEPAETVRVSGTSQDSNVGVVAAAIAIADNDEAPAPVLSVEPDTIAENGGTATVTVSTGEGSTYAAAQSVTLTLSGTATRGSDYTVGETVLQLPAGSGTAPSSVTTTLTAVDDSAADPDETVILSGSIGQAAVGAAQTVTIADDDPARSVVIRPVETTQPAVTLVLEPDEVTEGGTATITAEVSPASSEPFTVTLSAEAVSPADENDFTLAGTTLSFAAGAAESTGDVTVTAVDNDEDAPDKTVTVSGAVSLETVTAPADAMLSILDDDEPPPVESPAVALVLSPDSIGEDGGVSTVSATVSPASSEPFTVTLSAEAVSPADENDFTLAGTTLSFAAGAAESTGDVTVTAVDNDEDAPDRTVTVSGAVSLETVTAPPDATLVIVDDEPDVERGVQIVPTELTIGEGQENGGIYRVTLNAEPFAPVTVAVTVPTGSGLTVIPPRLRFTPLDWNVPQRVRVTAAAGSGAGGQIVRLSYRAAGAGYEDVPVAPVEVTVTDPGMPELRLANARGPEAGGPLVFHLTLSHAPERAVTVAYATRDATARAGQDYEAVEGTATIVAGGLGAEIAVPLRVDVLSEPEETFVLELSDADGAVLAGAHATGVIEDDPALASQWLARLSRLTGDHVMRAVEEQITAPRDGASQLTVAGLDLAGDESRLAALAGGFERFARARAGAASTSRSSGALALSDTGPAWQTRAGERPWRGDDARPGARFAPRDPGAFGAGELLGDSAFRLSGPGGGRGPSAWGRGEYTRFNMPGTALHPGTGLDSGGEALSATVGVDFAWSGGLFGLAASHTEAEADYGVSGQTAGTLEATLTGLYPYFGAQFSERISVWGLAGRGVGEQTATPESGESSAPLELESALAGLGARAELFAAERGFSLAMKTDALISSASFAEDALSVGGRAPGGDLPPGQGLLPAEGEWRRVRIGLEAAWQAEFDNGAALRWSLEASGLEDSGDAEQGFGAEVGANLRFIDIVPGLSLNFGANGLVSHDVEDYEEWSSSGALRYDPEPDSPAGPLVSLTHSWGAARTAPLAGVPGAAGLAPARTHPLARRDERLSAEFAWGFHAFGALGIPWAQVGTSGSERQYRLGYRLITHRGMPSAEIGASAFAREYRLGWEFAVGCRALVALQVQHTAAGLHGPADTAFELKFRSIGRGVRSACTMHKPRFTAGLPP